MATKKRLIDANSLVVEELLVMDRDYVDEFASGVRKVMNAIRRLPTVDAVEVVHGRWHNFENDPMWQQCSACDYILQYSYSKDCKYCPNCGAKMDLEGTDDDRY